MTQLAAPPGQLLGVGDSAPRVDVVPKVSGAFAFGSDQWATPRPGGTEQLRQGGKAALRHCFGL